MTATVAPYREYVEMRDLLVAIGNAIGFDPRGRTGWGHELLLAVQGYVETHNDTIEELAYARNALRDLSEKVLQLEELVGKLNDRIDQHKLRNRPAPQQQYPWPQPYPEPLDVPDIVHDPSWGGPTL